MAHLVVIELPGGSDPDVIQAALDRGDEVTFVSENLAHYERQPSVSRVLAATREQLEIPGFAYAEVERRVCDVHARHPINGLLCLIDTRIVEAARLAARLRLRHLNPESATLLRDKFDVRQRLAAAGIAQPPFALATTAAELFAAVDRLGLPVVIKPTDGYGSQNVVALRQVADLDPLLCPLPELIPSHNDYGLGALPSDRFIVERLLDGMVLGCDTLSRAGRHELLGIHEKRYFGPHSFAIGGGTFQPHHPLAAPIALYLNAVLDAVGFDYGATHTELVLTSDGLQVLEINPRLVGARIPRLVSLALHRPLHDELIRVHLGERAGTPSAPAQVGVTRWIVADRPGTLAGIDIPANSDERVLCVDVLKQRGDYVRPPIENADRIGLVMACADSAPDAVMAAENLVCACRVEIETVNSRWP